MLNPEDRRAIEDLFDRLAEVERRGTARDPEAEALIREEVARQPWAQYYMAQTILIQEQALKMAEERISRLEGELQGRPNDFLGELFGRRVAHQEQPPARERGPWERDERRYSRGGGFLAGAAQTALGVTGGLLLGNAIAGMLGAGEAQAGESSPEQGADHGADPDNGSFGDNDFGDDGGFDFGGDF